MKINGVTFEDWAAACANIANGMTDAEVCTILGLEAPVWDATHAQWSEQLANLPMEAMTLYSQIFANPKVGKFANAGNTSSTEDLLVKISGLDGYLKLQNQIHQAAKVGIDVDLEQEYGISTQEYGQLNVYFTSWVQENLQGANNTQAMAEYNAANQKWDSYWQEFYQDKSSDLGADIDF